jgi:opacity protein-like surface antigen
MRRHLLLAAASAALIAAPFAAHAQYGQPGGAQGPGGGGRGGGGDQQKQDQDDAKKKKRDKEWGDSAAPLAQMRNAGPCPFVKTLYDASRYVEFKDAREASANVGFTGEIQGISAGCQYKDNEPITVAMDVLFELGKGPQATGTSKTYHYWIAVTDRNREVIAKQNFELPVTFPAGKDRVYMTDSLSNIIIPRGSQTTSGANFEILVGFDVTPQMAEFNRVGKRFRVNAGSPTAVAAAAGDATTRR